MFPIIACILEAQNTAFTALVSYRGRLDKKFDVKNYIKKDKVKLDFMSFHCFLSENFYCLPF